MEEVFDISKLAQKSEIYQHTHLDDLGRGLEVPERALAHCSRLTALAGRLNTRLR